VRTRLKNEPDYSVVYVICIFSRVPVLDVKISFNAQEKIIEKGPTYYREGADT